MFKELHPEFLKASKEALMAEMQRIGALIGRFQGEGAGDKAVAVWDQFIRPCNGLVQRSSPRAVMTDDPLLKMTEIFNRYLPS